MFFKRKNNNDKVNTKKDIIMHIAGIAVSLAIAYLISKISDQGE